MDLPKLVKRGAKRVGRGYGSGKGGHTTGRGQKGQKARGQMAVLFEGMKVKKSLFKRLPLMRGKDKFKAKRNPIIVGLKYLDLLPSGKEINLELLIKEKVVRENDARKFGVKILGNGKVTKKLTVNLPISKSAAKEIEKAGGKVVASV